MIWRISFWTEEIINILACNYDANYHWALDNLYESCTREYFTELGESLKNVCRNIRIKILHKYHWVLVFFYLSVSAIPIFRLPNQTELLKMAASIRLSRALSLISKLKNQHILLHPISRQTFLKIQPASYNFSRRCFSTTGLRNDEHNSEAANSESNSIQFLT